MALPVAKKKVKKLADVLKECRISEPAQTTPLGTVINKAEDPALVAKWPKLRMKVSPLFLHKPVNFKEHALNAVNMGIKFYQPDEGICYTKIKCCSFVNHRSMAQYFDKNKLPYHTYGHPSKRKMKIVIKGLPTDTDLNTVKEELKKVSIPIIRLHKMHTKPGKERPLLVLAVVPHEDAGIKILAVKKILGHEVIMEPPKPKPAQCHRCQKWGHSQRYCYAPVKCVKCAGDHFSKKCTRDAEKEPPKCANCSGEHTANFKKCSFCPQSARHKLAVADKKVYMEGLVRPEAKLVTKENIDDLYKGKYGVPPKQSRALINLLSHLGHANLEDYEDDVYDDDIYEDYGESYECSDDDEEEYELA